MQRLRRKPRLLRRANVCGGALEIFLDYLNRERIAATLRQASAGQGQVGVCQPLYLRVGRDILILGSGKVELRARDAVRLRALVKDELLVHPFGNVGDEVEI